MLEIPSINVFNANEIPLIMNFLIVNWQGKGLMEFYCTLVQTQIKITKIIIICNTRTHILTIVY